MRRLLHGISFFAAAAILSAAASAQSGFPPAPRGGFAPRPPAPAAVAPRPAAPEPVVTERDAFINRLNANTVTVISGNPNGTYLNIAFDFSAVLDDGDDLRILPVVGKGAAQNVRDILYLRGVDMGITQSNILRIFKETGELGRNIENRVQYITRLFNEEMHVLAKSDINSLQDLSGKKVNFSDAGSGTQITVKLLFKDLKISVQEVNMGQADGIEAIKKGEIDATILLAGKPAGAFAKLPADPAYKLIPVPFTPELYDQYVPTTLTSDDYPGLVQKDAPINTIAISSVLAIFNWAPNTDRYRRAAKFTEALFKNFDKLLVSPRHPKWKEVNLAADLPGWTRFGAAQELVNRTKTANAAANDPDIKRAFDQFLRTVAPQDTGGASQARRDELFAKFMEWQKTQRAR